MISKIMDIVTKVEEPVDCLPKAAKSWNGKERRREKRLPRISLIPENAVTDYKKKVSMIF